MLRLYPELPDTASVINQSTLTRVCWLIWETMSMVGAGYVTARLAPRFESATRPSWVRFRQS